MFGDSSLVSGTLWGWLEDVALPEEVQTGGRLCELKVSLHLLLALPALCLQVKVGYLSFLLLLPWLLHAATPPGHDGLLSFRNHNPR